MNKQPKYKLSTKLYWCDYVHIGRVNNQWEILGGKVRVSKITSYTTTSDGKVIYNLLPNGRHEETELLKTFSLTEEEAKKRWEEPHIDTIKSLIDKEIRGFAAHIDYYEGQIKELEELKNTMKIKEDYLL